MMSKISPCESCTRVKNPADCENKQCRPWSKWFCARWDQIHGYYEKTASQGEKEAGQ